MTTISNKILSGAYDLQIHAGPDIVPRNLDAIDLAKEARAAGMAGILIKDHVTITSDRAILLNKLFPEIEIFGAMALNYPVGGLNPEAVVAAIRHGVKQVYMPTYAAAHDVLQNGGIKPVFKNLFPKGEKRGISLLSDSGSLLPAVEEIIEIIADTDVILGTGHISPHESLKLIKAASRKGVKNILVTHAMGKSVDMSVDDQKRAVDMGAMIEQSYLGCTAFASKNPTETINRMADQIKAVGAEHVVLSSDLGQKKNVSPVQGMREFVENLLEAGISKLEIDLMIRQNPEKLLGI